MKKFTAFSVLALVSVLGVGCGDSGYVVCADGRLYAERCPGGNNPQPGPTGMSMYVDGDGDLYGAGSPVSVCPSGTRCVLMAGDCNDSNASVRPGVSETCNNGVDDNCNGQIDEGCGGSGGNPSNPTPTGETCGNGRDDNGNGQIDEGCNNTAPVSNMEVRVVYELPSTGNVPDFSKVWAWNPALHSEAAPPSGCSSTIRARGFQCSWTQGRLQPFTAQPGMDLSSPYIYHDQQSGLANPAQTRIWGCTQGDWNSRGVGDNVQGFDDFGTTTIYIDGLFMGSASNGVLSGAMIRIDNASRAPAGSEAPRCGHGCNYGLAGFVIPRNSCTN